ncbi:hypothetical protein PPIS_a0889 [Pseudoalteromonas piscicida]|uniref:Uncharacterized protein n=1 Tax=Pseudoalteromonas piscicida TaxID=43662 RepID=A0ABM6NBH3_PSEO7|nr:hypothetical protein PPIS_a0889 [Pseudoalteromonas piscicida]
MEAKIINELKTKNGYSKPKSQGDLPREQVRGISLSAPFVEFFRPMTNGLIACSARP